jgi:hypothetical protein
MIRARPTAHGSERRSSDGSTGSPLAGSVACSTTQSLAPTKRVEATPPLNAMVEGLRERINRADHAYLSPLYPERPNMLLLETG